MPVRDSHDEIASLLARIPTAVEESLSSLTASIISGDPSKETRATLRFAETMAKSMTLADLFGRKRILLEVKAVPEVRDARIEPMLFSANAHVHFADQDLVPQISFDDAISDLVTREPTLAQTAGEVAEVYSRTHAFAIARSANLTLTKHVQKTVARLAEEGGTVPSAMETLSGMGPFTRAYSETVYRTNLSTAYSAGRFKQAQDPVVAQVIGGFRFVATKDSSVRHNHRAADGLIASQFDQIWETFTPPLGYNCRCGLRMVDRWDLEELGLLDGNRVQRSIPATFSNAYPDPGFGMGRPDRALYGG